MGASFVLLPGGSKFPPLEENWQNRFHSYDEAYAHNGNVGVKAGNGFIGLDMDNPEAFQGLDLPATTCWETRPGRLGFWFRSEEDIPSILKVYVSKGYGFKPDQAQIILKSKTRHVGEIKLQRSYQVIPPSWKTLDDGTRVQYRLCKDTPPSVISLDWLLAELVKIGISPGKKSKASNGKSYNQILSRGRHEPASRSPGLRKYAETALSRESEMLARTKEGERNDQLNKSAFAIGQLVAAGLLDESEAISDLTANALKTGLDNDEIRRTIDSGLDAGKLHPREISEKRSCAEDKRIVSRANQIVEMVLAGGAELWHTPNKEGYATFRSDQHQEHYLIDSTAFSQLVGKMIYDITGKTPGSQSIKDAGNVLSGLAIYDGDEYAVYVRVAPFHNAIYVDLGDGTWDAVEITCDGWKIVSNPPVRFRRPATMLPLPRPERGGSWDDFKNLLGIQDENVWILTVGWIMQAYWPWGPYAHLVLNGEQGSGKTKLTELLKMLVDPSQTALRRPPRFEQDLMISANSDRILGYDNLSGLSSSLSDAFCVLSTGGVVAGRTLYTNNEESVLAAKRPAILNGIDSIATRGDLLDRSIVIDLQAIPDEKRRKEKDIMDDFDRFHPRLFGLILDATSEGIKRVKSVDLDDLPRLADFVTWVAACETRLPWEVGRFLEVYRERMISVMIDQADTNRFTTAVLNLVKSSDKIMLEFSPTELWEQLNYKEGIDPNHIPNDWPKSRNQLTNWLKRASPQMRAKGVDLSTRRTGKARTIQLLRYDSRVTTVTASN